MSKKIESVKWKNSWCSLEQELEDKLSNTTSKLKKEAISDIIKTMKIIKKENTTVRLVDNQNSNSSKRKNNNHEKNKNNGYAKKVSKLTSNFLDKLRID